MEFTKMARSYTELMRMADKNLLNDPRPMKLDIKKLKATS